MTAKQQNIEDIYPLAPLQEGMLFHTLYDAGAPMYFQQHGQAIDRRLDIAAFAGAWRAVIERHPILRTAIVWKRDGKPLQVVLRRVALPLEQHDWRDLTVADQEQRWAGYLEADRLRGFDLASAPLMRLALVRLADDRYHVLWSFHHVLLDGWSRGLVLEQVWTCYERLAQGLAVEAEATQPYKEYISWLQRQDQTAAERFWREYLGGFRAPTALQLERPDVTEPAAGKRTGHFAVRLSQPFSAMLQTQGRQAQLTLGTLVQGAWALLLSRYSGEQDVVFGVTVSGRPVQLAGVESIAGLFINTLPVRVHVPAEAALLPWLHALQQQLVELRRYEYTPLVQVQRWSEVPRQLPLFESLLVFDNTVAEQDDCGSASAAGEVDEDVVDDGSLRTVNYPLTLAVRPGRRLWLGIKYDASRLEPDAARRMIGHLQALLEQMAVAGPQQLGDLSLLSPAKREQIVSGWNATRTAFPADRCVQQLFEQQAARTPDAPAVDYDGRSLSYAELNRRANQLAHHLRSLGVGTEVPVAICVERSLDMVVGLLGILKAGGVYVPLDSDYPPERLALLLEDTGAPVLLAQSHLVPLLPTHRPKTVMLDRDWDSIARHGTQNPVCESGPENLAYVIYTSGSTGRPKGVGVPHRAINRLIFNTNYIALQADDRIAQASNAAFDAATFEIWGALLSGACIVGVPRDITLAPLEFAQRLREQGITTLFLTTALFNQLAREAPGAFSTLRHVLFGGEAVDPRWPQNVLEHQPPQRLLHVYGPTESTTFASWFPVEQVQEAAVSIPIGFPLSNTEIYVLDNRMQPVPVGLPGELYIGGDGLARGYVQRPALTAEKFVPHPFSDLPGARLYRTGDQVRFAPDGSVEFIGRIDHQVKIRGFRIEPGEIEATLLQLPGVRDCIVLVREDLPGVKQLVAYVAGSGAAPLLPHELRRRLMAKLPAYMVPAAVMVLEQLPLNQNGKVDRRALPRPALDGAEREHDFAAPQTPVEQQLAQIWAEVLGVQQVGVDDNYYSLGGDSILSIQIVARARQAGLHLTPKQIFERQTIRELADGIDDAAQFQAEQGAVAGSVPLTPIQRWFFELELDDAHHFNQSLMLTVRHDLAPARLEQALRELLRHHDALRMRFTHEASGPHQQIAAQGDAPVLAVEDLSNVHAAEQRARIEATAAAAQASLDLAAGPVLRAVFFDLGAGHPGRLLLCIHHLVVDGVSWRILLDDLELACSQLANGRPVQLPPKTSSFKLWAERLDGYAQSVDAAEREHWLAAAATPRLPIELPARDGHATQADVARVEFALDAAETQALLHEVPPIYRTQINDALLAALAQTLVPWIGSDSLLLQLEGHGREPLFDDVDVSRTVGWFTSSFPVLLELAQARDPGAALRSVKEQLRQIPRHGIGYGILRYLGRDRTLAAALAALPTPEVSFNYLGQFDGHSADASWFGPAAESVGPEVSPLGRQLFPLEVVGLLSEGRLQFTWSYDAGHFRHATIERLAHTYGEMLRALVAHCRLAEAGDYTPSDFPLARLSQQQLEAVLGTEVEVDDLYPLAPMQQAMLLHSVTAPASALGFVQEVLEVRGELAPELLRQAWQQVVDRHPILRSEFRWEGLAEPLQVVRRRLPVQLEHYDWRGLAPAEQETRLAELLRADRERGFNLRRAPLMRLALIRLEQAHFRYVWSIHHVLLDGWCKGQIQSEVIAFYRAAVEGRVLKLEQPRPFREYIAWLMSQDRGRAESFWRELLAGYKTPAPLLLEAPHGTPDGDDADEQRIVLSRETTSALHELARRYKVTLSTLVQGAWAILLSAYSGTQDVMFGITVAGRPAELAGVESMMGMFINNLPLRVAVTPDQPAVDFFGRLQAQQVAMGQFEHTPPADIQRWSEVPAGVPLFESLLVFENYPLPEPQARDAQALDVRVLHESGTRTGAALTIVADPSDELPLTILYDQRRFAPAAIRRLLAQYRMVLEQLVTHPRLPLGKISLLSAGDRQRMALWNEPVVAPPVLTVAQLFEQQAARDPDATALVDGLRPSTFAELRQRAARLAATLRQRGVQPDQVVALYAEPSAALVVGLLGVAYAGAAWMLVDPSLRPEQVAETLRRHDIRLLLAEAAPVGGLLAAVGTIDVLDLEAASVSELPPAWRPAEFDPARLACRIDEPATGRSITYSQRAVTLNIQDLQSRLALGPRDGIWVLPAEGAPLSGVELLLPLLSGARLVLSGNAHAVRPEQLGDAPTHAATVLYAAPATWQRLAFLGWKGDPALTLLSSGEPLDDDTARLLGRRCASIWTLYQPGGSGLWAAAEQLSSHDEPAAIERPLPNTQLYLLDAALRPLPAGIAGQLYLGGVTVPSAVEGGTAAGPGSFVFRQFDAPTSALLYATGDLGRFRDDGKLDLLGSAGNRAGLRGYPVDLAAVERALAQHPEIETVVAVVREDTPGERRLVAYYTPRGAQVPTARQLRGALRDRIADWMVPSDFVAMDAMPLTPNGVPDRSALPVPGLHYSRDRLRLKDEVTANHDIVEFQLTEIWEQLLDIRPIRSSDDFFDLGGTSLLALQLMGQILQRFGLDLPMAVLFEEPTITRLAQRIREQNQVAPWSPLVAIQPRGSRPPFFCVHAAGGNILGFVDLARHLDPDQPFYGLQSIGLDGEQAPLRSVAAMASRYVEEIRRVQPEGPYRLGGLSFGGFVAFEMAQQLRQQGQDVALLALLDTWAPTFQGRPVYREAVRDDAELLLDTLAGVTGFYGHEHTITAAELQPVPPERRVDYLVDQVRDARLVPPGGLEQLRRVLQIHQSTGQALRDYLPQQVYAGRITIFRAQELADAGSLVHHPALGTPALLEEWSAFSIEPPAIVDVPGDHLAMMFEPHVRVLAARLTDALAGQLEGCPEPACVEATGP